MPYAFPLERPIVWGASDFCHGPFVYGSTQIAQFQTRWVAWVGTNGIRFGYWTPGVLFNDVDGQADDLFPPGTRPSHLSFSFEQDALHALAIQTAVNTCAVRRKVAGVPTEYTFTGRSPILFYNGILEADTALTDLTVFYIKSAGDKIYVRRQRDNFGIEYILNPTLKTTLRALQKTDAVAVGGSRYQVLWGISTDGRQVYYMSAPYPLGPFYAEDRLSLATGFDSGEMSRSTVPTFAPGDAISLLTGFDSGVFLLVVIDETLLPEDALDYLVGFDIGEYRLIILEIEAAADAVAVDTGFDSGSMDLVIVESDSPPDAVGIDTGFDSGVYTI